MSYKAYKVPISTIQSEKSQLHGRARLGVGDVTGEEATAIRPKGEMRTVLHHLATLLASVCAELNRPVAPQTQTEQTEQTNTKQYKTYA